MMHVDAVKATALSGGIGGSLPEVKATALSGGIGGSLPEVKATVITYFPDLAPSISHNEVYDPIDERVFLTIPNFDGNNVDGWATLGGFASQTELVSGYPEAKIGTKFFRGGNSATSSGATTILFSAYERNGILTGNATFELSWNQRAKAGTDTGSGAYEFFDSLGVSLGSWSSPAITASTTTWDTIRTTNIAIPATADKVVIALSAVRGGGITTDAFFDNIRASVGIPKTSIAVTPFLGNSNYRTTLSVTPTNCWSMIRRNDLYTGPALRVEDGANPGTFVDIGFDATGKVSGPMPYVDNRCIILYDQFNQDDFKATAGNNIQVIYAGGTKTTWGLRPTGTGMWTDRQTSTFGNEPIFQMPNLSWNLAIERTSNTSSLQNIFGITTGIFLEYGLWLEARDLHWRVNGSGPQDWGNTDWFIDSANVQNTISRCISDMTANPDSVAYFNNTLVATQSATLPITYSNNKSLGLFDHQGVGNPWTLGDFYELAIYSPISVLSVADRTFIDAAMQEFG